MTYFMGFLYIKTLNFNVHKQVEDSTAPKACAC